MSQAKTYAELQAMSDDDLVREYDRNVTGSYVGVDFIRDELHRREMARAESRMLLLTVRISRLTLVVTIATLINVALVGVSLWTILG